jgi:hypothetical protein
VFDKVSKVNAHAHVSWQLDIWCCVFVASRMLRQVVKACKCRGRCGTLRHVVKIDEASHETLNLECQNVGFMEDPQESENVAF